MDISKRIIHLLQLQVERLHFQVLQQMDESQSSNVHEDLWWVVELYRSHDLVVQVVQDIQDQVRVLQGPGDIM